MLKKLWRESFQTHGMKHTWDTTKQNVIFWGILLYFLLHINRTRIQTWKKKKSFTILLILLTLQPAFAAY